MRVILPLMTKKTPNSRPKIANAEANDATKEPMVIPALCWPVPAPVLRRSPALVGAEEALADVGEAIWDTAATTEDAASTATQDKLGFTLYILSVLSSHQVDGQIELKRLA